MPQPAYNGIRKLFLLVTLKLTLLANKFDGKRKREKQVLKKLGLTVFFKAKRLDTFEQVQTR